MARRKNPAESGPPPEPKKSGPQYDAVARMTKVETGLPVAPKFPPPTPPRKPIKRGSRE